MNAERPEQQPSGSEPSEVDELIASVSALREEIDRRFGGDHARDVTDLDVERDGPTRAAAERGLLGRLRDAALESNIDPARWLEALRELVPLPMPGDVSDRVDGFGLDERYLQSSRPLLDFLYERWWRVAVTGAESLPDAPRLIFVANRSGVLPYDGLMLAHAVEREHPAARRPRFLAEDWLMTRPFAAPLLARLGGVRGCPDNAARLLAQNEWLIVFPEGHKGALKRYRERYRLQRFGRGGFISLAIRRRALLVPVAIVGAEEAHPVIARSEWLERALGVSPPLTLTFPLLGPLGLIPLPSQWRIRFGPALDLSDEDPSASGDQIYLSHMRERMRSTIQELLDEEVDRRYSVWS